MGNVASSQLWKRKFDLIVTASLYIQQLELYKKLTLQAGIFPLKVLRLSWGR